MTALQLMDKFFLEDELNLRSFATLPGTCASFVQRFHANGKWKDWSNMEPGMENIPKAYAQEISFNLTDWRPVGARLAITSSRFHNGNVKTISGKPLVESIFPQSIVRPGFR